MNAIKTSIVNTHELKEGDEILCYGVHFRLKNREDYGDCIAFDTDLISYPDQGSPMPRPWAEDWRVQGNKLAYWAKVER